MFRSQHERSSAANGFSGFFNGVASMANMRAI
jgi:hypothetical protein